MKLLKIVVGMTVACLAGLAVKLVWDIRRAEWDKQIRESSKVFERSPYAEVVAETLREHQGEDTPLVHAFEEALETESRMERQLAHDTGLRL